MEGPVPGLRGQDPGFIRFWVGGMSPTVLNCLYPVLQYYTGLETEVTVVFLDLVRFVQEWQNPRTEKC
jgi:hypothetical protein